MQMPTEFQFTPFLVENSSGWYDIKYNYIIISINRYLTSLFSKNTTHNYTKLHLAVFHECRVSN